MNNHQRFSAVAVIDTQVAVTTCHLLSTPAWANESEALFELCSSFPLNSQCEGYEAPISLDNRPGGEARCQFSGAENAEDCRLSIGEEDLLVYIEFGEGLSILDGEKSTTEVIIPLSAIQGFAYAEDSRANVGAILALGLPGLLVRKRTATFNVRYSSEAIEADETVDTGEGISEATVIDATAIDTDAPIEASAEFADTEDVMTSEQPPQQFLFVMRQESGREMRQQLEAATGITAENFAID